MKNIILVAPPAAGKGTLSKQLSDNLGYISLSTGDMLREASKSNLQLQEEIKSGKLISDETVFSILEEKINNLGAVPYILDGFPRTEQQAIMYKELLQKINKKIGVVIYLDVPKEELEQRVTTRVICPNCKKSYSLRNKLLKPIEEGICDDCKETLIQRVDDSKEVFDQRYEEYLSKTQPLIDFYETEGILKRITSQTIDDVYEDALKIID